LTNPRLSKTKILLGMQCPRRLYLEVYHPEFAEVSEETEQILARGNDVGQAARDLLPKGILIDTGGDLGRALQETSDHLSRRKNATLFEAAFEHQDVLIKADILHSRSGTIKLVEVKSTTLVKPYHIPDVAVQFWVLKGAGYEPRKVELAYIDNSFVYPGNGDYQGLFTKADMTEEVLELQREIPKWVKKCKQVLRGDMPSIEVGDQCESPFDCPFYSYCTEGTTMPEYPVGLLPWGGKTAEKLLELGICDLRDAKEDQLSKPLHRKVWRATKTGKPEIDPAVSAEIRKHPYPRYYLDFETIAFAIPVWAGTRPYQQIPFQWSCHIEHQNGTVEHKDFLDTTGDLPVKSLAECLIATVGSKGPVYSYGAFERTMINAISEMLPGLAPKLGKIRSRIVDLLPIARQSYYHPAMKGSWSMKSVLPTIAPSLNYDSLEVQHGGMAQQAYLEATAHGTTAERQRAIRENLLEYCGRDTEGLFAIARFLENAAAVQIS